MKGKEAAHAAARRAAAVESELSALKDEVQNLKREARESDADHAREITALHAEISERAERRAAELLDTEIARRVADEVASTFATVSEDRALAVINVLRRTFRWNEIAANQGDFMAQVAVALGVPHMAGALQIQWFELSGNREQRRRTPKEMRAIHVQASEAAELERATLGLALKKKSGHDA